MSDLRFISEPDYLVCLKHINEDREVIDIADGIIIYNGEDPKTTIIRQYRTDRTCRNGERVIHEGKFYRAIVETGMKDFDANDFISIEGRTAYVQLHDTEVAYSKDDLIIGPEVEFEKYPVWYCMEDCEPGNFEDQKWGRWHPGEVLEHGYGYLDPEIKDDLEDATTFTAQAVEFEPEAEWDYSVYGTVFDVRIPGTLFQDLEMTIPAVNEGDEVAVIKPINTDDPDEIIYKTGYWPAKLVFDENGYPFVKRHKYSQYAYKNAAALTDTAYFVSAIPGKGAFTVTNLDNEFTPALGTNSSHMLSVAVISKGSSEKQRRLSEFLIESAAHQYARHSFFYMDGYWEDCKYPLYIHPGFYCDLVVSLERTFIKTNLVNKNIEEWDTSMVFNLNRAFDGADIRGIDLTKWNLEKAINLGNMLKDSTYDGPGNFNLPQANNIGGFFYGAREFNSPVKDFSAPIAVDARCFLMDTKSFNQPVDEVSLPEIRDAAYFLAGTDSFDNKVVGIDLPKATNTSRFLKDAVSFKQSVDGLSFPSAWDCREFLMGCTSFNNPIDGLDLPVVNTVDHFLSGATTYNQPIDIVSRWTGLTNAESFLEGAASYNLPVNDLVCTAIYAQRFFKGCPLFNQSLANTSWPEAESLEGLLENCVSFNENLEGMSVPKAQLMANFLSGCVNFNKPVAGFNVKAAIDLKEFFKDCSAFNQPLPNWVGSNRYLALARFLKNASSFDQDLSTWCVPHNASTPEEFAVNTVNVIEPNWGDATCII